MSNSDRPHQIENAAHHVTALRSPLLSAGDWGEPGTGKTRTALRVIRQLGVPSLVVGPKIGATQWKRAAQETGTGLTYINWESVRSGNSPLLSVVTAKRLPGDGKKRQTPKAVWHSAVKFLVFDEARKAKSRGTYNEALVLAALEQRIPRLLMDATPPADPTRLYAIGQAFGLHSGFDWFGWCLRNGCWKPPFGGLEFTSKEERKKPILEKFQRLMEPYCTRTRLVDVYPQAQAIIEPHLYDLPEASLMAELSEKLRGMLEDRVDRGAAGTQLRQQMEWLRTPVLEELIENGIDSGHSVLTFANFRETLQELKRKRPGAEIIDGSTPPGKRDEIMDALQRDALREVLLQTVAGGETLNAQDITGKYPRLSLVCPGASAEQFTQIVGRTRRLGQKTPALVRVVLAAESREERIFERLKAKCRDLRRLVEPGFWQDSDFRLD